MFGTGTNTSWHKFKRNLAKVKVVLLFFVIKMSVESNNHDCRRRAVRQLILAPNITRT